MNLNKKRYRGNILMIVIEMIGIIGSFVMVNFRVLATPNLMQDAETIETN